MKTNRRLVAYLWDLSRGQRGRILLSCLTGILGTAFALGFVYTSKQLIDIATGARAGSLTVMAAATVGLLVLQLLCGAAETWIAARMEVEAANALRHRLFGRLLRSRWNALEQLHTGDVVNRVEQDTAAIVTLLTASLPTAVVTAVQLVAAFAFFYVLDPVLPWLVVGILPLFLLGARFYLRRMKRLTHAVRCSDRCFSRASRRRWRTRCMSVCFALILFLPYSPFHSLVVSWTSPLPSYPIIHW